MNRRTTEQLLRLGAFSQASFAQLQLGAQLEDIAKIKLKDLTGADLDAAVRTIAGTARSMGITVEGVV